LIVGALFLFLRCRHPRRNQASDVLKDSTTVTVSPFPVGPPRDGVSLPVERKLRPSALINRVALIENISDSEQHPSSSLEQNPEDERHHRGVQIPRFGSRRKRSPLATVRVEVVTENHRDGSMEIIPGPTPDMVIQPESSPIAYRHQDSGWRPSVVRNERPEGLREVIELPPDYSEV